VATTLKGQTPPSTKARQEAKVNAAPAPVFVRTFATAEEFIAGQTCSNVRATYGPYGAVHGADALARYVAALEAAMTARTAAREAKAAAAAAEPKAAAA
jgi:hypothetical protein